jgi:cytochrome c oxidase assembly protein Cox11
MGKTNTKLLTNTENAKLLTGKRKEITTDFENSSESEEEVIFQDSRKPMETEHGTDNKLMYQAITGGGDQTNSQSEEATNNMQVK